MGQEDAVDNRRYTRELFEGKDVVVGRDIVNFLKVEGVGVQVYTRFEGNKKTRVIVDREPGVEDFVVREKDESEKKLLGIVVPTGRREREFVFLSAEEEGFVFEVDERGGKNYDSEVTTIFNLRNWERFTDYFNFASSSHIFDARRILTESKNPQEYEQLVLAAVQKERQRIADQKEKRKTVRDSLFHKLFGGE